MTKHHEALGHFGSIEDLFLVTLFFTAGIGLANRISPSWTIYLVALVFGGGVYVSLQFTFLKLAKALIFPLFLFLGIIHASPTLQPPKDLHHLYNNIVIKQEASLIGILHSMPSAGEETTSFVINTKKIIKPSETKNSSGLVKLTMPGRFPKGFTPGDVIIVRTTLSRIPPPSTPGEFDYHSFLALQDIWVKGWVPSPIYLTKIQPDHELSLVHQLRYMPEKARYSIALFIDQNLLKDKAGLYKAILLGDKSGISPALIENFKSAGVMHLLAISGLHMGLLALCSITFFYWLFKISPRFLLAFHAKKIAAFLSLVPLVMYAFLAGFNIPVVRSLIMISVFVLSLIWNRQWSLRNTIAIACLLILLFQPDQISSVSFQLSFAAVFSIGLFASFYALPEGNQNKRKRQSKFHKFTIWTQNALLVSLAAMAGTFPLLLYHFNRFSPISPISTLIVEPFLCFWSLLLGLAACLVLPFSPWLADWFLKIGYPGLLAVEHSVNWLASLPYSHVWLPTPTPFEIFLFYFALLMISQIKKNKIYILAASCCLTLLVSTILFSIVQKNSNQKANISFLDVGQGSSTVLELPHGHSILIDCGKRSHNMNVDIGQRLVAPYLWSKRITELDQVIITHPHADHFNGLFSILKQFKPDVIWINGDTSSNPQYQDLLTLARQIGTEIRIPKAGEILYENMDVWLENIAGHHLLDEEGEVSRLSTNDKSLILRLHHGKRNALFPGDISWIVEEKLLDAEYDINADILLAAHHGANESNSVGFIQTVAPEYIVISGKPPKKSEHHDFKNGLFEEMNGLINTKEYGSVFFGSDGEQFTLLQNRTHR